MVCRVARRLEIARHRANLCFLCQSQLPVRQSRRTNSIQLLQDLRDRRRGYIRPHTGTRDEWARQPASVKERESTIGVTVRFAQVQVDAAGEEPTQGVVHHSDRFVIGRRARDPNARYTQLRLGGVRNIHDHELGLTGGRRSQLWNNPCPRGPRAEFALGQSAKLRRVDLAGYDQRRVARNETRSPETHEVVAGS